MTKNDFLEKLSNEGYAAAFLRGIPTVYVQPETDMAKESKKIKKFANGVGYDQSFGIAYQKKETA